MPLKDFICSADGCGRFSVRMSTNGPLCNAHALRWKRYGRLTPKPLLPNYAERRAWANMNSRCNNPNTVGYANYGGRGVKSEFQSFDEFFACLGPRPGPGFSVDRINVNGNYAPGNVRWATKDVQCRNQRRNRTISYNGVTQTLIEWALQIGVTANTLLYRLDRGWGIERALTTKTSSRRGSDHAKAKLSEDAALAIRASSASDSVLAKEYGVARAAIWAIRKRRSWQHA